MNYNLLSPFLILLFLYIWKRNKICFSYFNNKNIIITGGSSGIGESIASILEKNTNCKLHLLARSFENSTSENVFKYKCDCSKYDNVKEIISEIKNIDIIIHSAGTGDWKYLPEMDIKEINTCLGAPLMSSLNLTQLTLPKMMKQNSGQIVFIQSPVVLQPWSSCTAYSISRWGMRGLSESLRADLFNTNISVSEIILGRTDSNYFKTNKHADERFPKIGNLISRITPNEAALAVIKTIQKKHEYEYYPFTMKLVVHLNEWFPSIVRYLTFKTGWSN